MRIFVVKKNTIIRAIVFVVLIAAAIIYTQVIAADSTPTIGAATKSMPVCSVETEDPAVAITIDTAFGDDFTDEILKVLEEKQVKATFFVMGLWAQKNPEKLAAIVKAGHEVENHSMNHQRYTEMTADEIKNDAEKARDTLKVATGKSTVFLRQPYGAYNDQSIDALTGDGFVPVNWNVDSKDWKQIGRQAIRDNVINNTKKGSIIIFQNNIADTPLALGDIIDDLKAKNFQMVKLSDFLMTDNYMVDESGVQKSFND